MPEVRGTGTVAIDPREWWVPALLGALSIVAGILAIAYPDITLLVLGLIVGLTTLALLAGIGFIVRGTVELMAGIYIRSLRAA